MRRWSVVLDHFIMVAVVLLGSVVSDRPRAHVAAQDATPAGEEISVETLFSTTLDVLPPAPIPVALARITFEPGAGLSMNANPGPALHFVEEGNFSVTMAGAATLIPDAAATPGVQGVEAPGGEFEIVPGDLLVIPANTPFEVFNRGATPAVAIIIEYFARPAGAVFPPGIALTPLVVGELTTLPPGPVTLDLVRVTFPPELGLPPSENTGSALVSIEAGAAGYTLEDEGQVWQAATPGAAPESADATPGVEVLLGPGAGVIDQRGSVSAVRNAGDAPLVVLSLSHHPAKEAGTPAP